MNTLFTITESYLKYCETQKGLIRKHLRHIALIKQICLIFQQYLHKYYIYT
jgi:hypothetical protein